MSRLLLTAFILLFVAAECDIFKAQPYRRIKRAELPLLFYGNSAITLIFGFGVPVQDLDIETVVSGVVLKCYYQLPSRPEDLKPHNNLAARSLHQYTAKQKHNFLEKPANVTEFYAHSNLSKYRWLLYKSMELFSERLGYPGRVCILKSICEAAAIPFHHYNGILGELAHLLMTPSSSTDELSSHSDKEYYYAEDVGRSGHENCHKIFKDCNRSVLDYFTTIFDYSKAFIA